MLRWLVVALLLAACGPNLPTMRDQAAATTFVWNEQYGMTVMPPVIEWVTGPTLDCAGGKGWYSTLSVPPGCVAGLTFWDQYTSYVAWPAGSVFSTTAFAHELCHARDGIVTNGVDLDPYHTGDCFAPGGLVEKANSALAKVGL